MRVAVVNIAVVPCGLFGSLFSAAFRSSSGIGGGEPLLYALFTHFTLMIGTGTRVGKDGTRWWRQEGSAPDHHLKNWKVMLWVVASLVTLVEGVSPEEDNKDMLSRPLPGHRKSSQPPHVHTGGQRLSSHHDPTEGQRKPTHVQTDGQRLSSHHDPTEGQRKPPHVHTEGQRLSSQHVHTEGQRRPPHVHTEGQRLSSQHVILFHVSSSLIHTEGQRLSSQPPHVHTGGQRLSSQHVPTEGQRQPPHVPTEGQIQPPHVHTEGQRQPPHVPTEGQSLSSQPPHVHTEGQRLRGRSSSILASQPAVYEEAEDDRWGGRWGRAAADGTPFRPARKNRRRSKQQQSSSSSRDCRMERKEMRVRDLGLGYDSDEIVLFKYCVGTCHSSRRNYDLALRALMANGSVALAADHRAAVSAHPCCRPTRYETVSFMDAQTVWQTIKWLSAANCSCVG